MSLDKEKQLAAAMRQLEILQLAKCFDPAKPESRPNEQQETILQGVNDYLVRWVVGGNQSGKSQLGAREVSWLFQETHPFFSRPKEWGDKPLTILVIGRTMTQVEEELWAKKIKPFLPAGCYEESKKGGMLYKVTNTRNKNRILFFSHHNTNEAREKLQSYTAHYAWFDEETSDMKLLEEIQRRLQANRGRFLGTLTNKKKNPDLRRLVDADIPHQKKYELFMLNNPIYKGREHEILDSLKTHTEGYVNAVLYGHWYDGEGFVYEFTEAHVEAPPGYDASWRHREAIDPASASKTGFILLAEQPSTGVWYVIKAKYIIERVPSTLVEKARDEVGNVNLLDRVADSHETWFISEAGKAKISYRPVEDKTNRKQALIKNLQQLLHDGKLKVAPWCEKLIDEFHECQWSETVDQKIVDGSRFHLLDALQYGVDSLPRPMKVHEYKPFEAQLKEANRIRKVKEASRAQFGKLPRRGKLWASKARRVKVSWPH